MTLFLLYLFGGVYLRILIYIIKILVNLSQYQETVGTFNNCYLIRFRNNYRHFKYYLSNIDITFGVMLFSCIILITISILFLSLTFGFFVSNTIKIFLFTRFRKIKGVFVSILFSHFCFFFFTKAAFKWWHWNYSGPEDSFEQPLYHLSLELEQNFCP